MVRFLERGEGVSLNRQETGRKPVGNRKETGRKPEGNRKETGNAITSGHNMLYFECRGKSRQIFQVRGGSMPFQRFKSLLNRPVKSLPLVSNATMGSFLRFFFQFILPWLINLSIFWQTNIEFVWRSDPLFKYLTVVTWLDGKTLPAIDMYSSSFWIHLRHL